MELSGTTFDAIPDLTSRRGSALGTDKRVNASAELGDRVLNMAALGVASAEEDGVEHNQNPGSSLEEDGR